jgi:hypothetical protein
VSSVTRSFRTGLTHKGTSHRNQSCRRRSLPPGNAQYQSTRLPQKLLEENAALLQASWPFSFTWATNITWMIAYDRSLQCVASKSFWAHPPTCWSVADTLKHFLPVVCWSPCIARMKSSFSKHAGRVSSDVPVYHAPVIRNAESCYHSSQPGCETGWKVRDASPYSRLSALPNVPVKRNSSAGKRITAGLSFPSAVWWKGLFCPGPDQMNPAIKSSADRTATEADRRIYWCCGHRSCRIPSEKKQKYLLQGSVRESHSATFPGCHAWFL